MKRALVLGFLLCTELAIFSFAAKGPNVVLILADDMGYSDLGCYGG